MKKTIIILFVLGFCFSTLTGCGMAAQTDTQNSVSEPAIGPDEENSSGFRDAPYSQEGISGLWRCTLQEADYSPEIFGYLHFSEDGNVAFDYGTGYGPAGMGMVMYRGTWYLDPDMGPSNMPDPLFLDLSLDCAMFAGDENQFPSKISGIYTFIIEDEFLSLTFVDGDYLYGDSGEFLQNYDLERDDPPQDAFTLLCKMSDTESADYLKANSPEAADYLASGMSAMATGGFTQLPNGEFGRHIGLGAKQRNYYEYQVLYVISTDGDIFQEDSVG